MFWWRGNGLLIGLLAVIPAVGAMKLGATHVALAYAISAVLVFLLRNAIGAESSLFSITTKFWPPLLVLIALVIQFTSPPEAPKKTLLEQRITDIQAHLPRKLNEQIRLDSANLAGATLNYDATATAAFENDSEQNAALERDARKLYCDDLPTLGQAAIGMKLNVTIPPKSLSQRQSIRTLEFNPTICR